MSKTRKSGNRYAGSPSTRDKLSSAFVEALEKDWAEHGASVIAAVREQAPAKYAELVVRLVPMDSDDDPIDGFNSANSMPEIGRRLLQSVGADEFSLTDQMIQAAVEANDEFIARLEAIRDKAQN